MRDMIDHFDATGQGQLNFQDFLRVAQRCFSEPQIVRGCFALGAVAFVVYGLASAAWPLYLAMVPLGVSVAAALGVGEAGVLVVDDEPASVHTRSSSGRRRRRPCESHRPSASRLHRPSPGSGGTLLGCIRADERPHARRHLVAR